MNTTLLEILTDMYEVIGQDLINFDREKFEEEVSDTEVIYRDMLLHPMCGYQGEFDYCKFKITVTLKDKIFKVKVVQKIRRGKVPKHILEDLESGNKEHVDIDWTDIKHRKKENQKIVDLLEFDNPHDVIKLIDKVVIYEE